MPRQVKIYHNPRCSKSRQTLQLLRDKGIEPEIVEYLKDSPSAKETAELIDMLGVEPHAVLRVKEAAYKEAGLTPQSSKQEIARAIAEHPILLERPIVVVDGRNAALGRPPEGVEAIL